MMLTLLCGLTAFLALLGIALDFSMDTAEERRHKFVYYTNLSNLLSALYHLLFLFALIAGRDSALFSAVAAPAIHFSVAMCVFVTFVIYLFVLAPSFRRHGIMPKHPARKFANLCVHYFVPLLSMSIWLACGNKDLAFFDSLLWMLLPAVYTVFVMLRAKSGIRLAGPRNSLYPYGFIDLEKLGIKKFLRNSLFTFAAFFALSAILYFLSRLVP